MGRFSRLITRTSVAVALTAALVGGPAAAQGRECTKPSSQTVQQFCTAAKRHCEVCCRKPVNQSKEEFCTPERLSCDVCSDGDSFESPFQAVPEFNENYARSFAGSEGEGEIYVGKEAKRGQFSETVFLTTSSDPDPPSGYCTGVLIASTVVLTARHCIVDDSVGQRESIVRFGRGFAEAKTADRQRIVEDIRAINIPHEVDLALLKLNSAAPAWAKPAVLASEATLHSNTSLRIVGFGENTSNVHHTKLFTDVGIASWKCIRGVLVNKQPPPRHPASLFGCITGQDTVAGYFGPEDGLHADACHGDSGGPAFVVSADQANPLARADREFERNKYFLAAITRSRITTGLFSSADERCGHGGLYTRVVDKRMRDEIVKQARRSPWNATVRVQP